MLAVIQPGGRWIPGGILGRAAASDTPDAVPCVCAGRPNWMARSTPATVPGGPAVPHVLSLAKVVWQQQHQQYQQQKVPAMPHNTSRRGLWPPPPRARPPSMALPASHPLLACGDHAPTRAPHTRTHTCIPVSPIHPPTHPRRYEGRIVQQLIRNDGGSGDYQEITPDMLGIWNTVLNVSGNTGPWEGAARSGGPVATVGSRLWAVWVQPCWHMATWRVLAAGHGACCNI